MYNVSIFLLTVGAIVGFGSFLAFSIIAGKPKTITQAKYNYELIRSLGSLARKGAIVLPIAFILMNISNSAILRMHSNLISVIIFLVIETVVIKTIPKNIKKQMEALEKAENEELPPEYIRISKKNKKIEWFAYTAGILLILLMVFKPF